MLTLPALTLTLAAAAVLLALSCLVTARAWHTWRMAGVEELERLHRLTEGRRGHMGGRMGEGHQGPYSKPQQASGEAWRWDGALAGMGEG